MLASLRARTLVASVLATSLIAPPVSAAPAATDADRKAQADFEAGFIAGQQQFDGGQFVEAARTWGKAAANLKESAKNKDNRQAVFEYIAEAWTKGLAGSEDVALLREAVQELDAYCKGFTVAYGTETPVLPKIVQARDTLQEQLKAAEASKPSTPEGPADLPPDEQPEGPTEPGEGGPKWKGLAIGGGVALGVGVGLVVMAAVGGARGQAIEKDFTQMSCDPNMPAPGQCTTLADTGKTMNTLAIAGGVAGGVLVITGAVLLGIGLKRRAASQQQAFAPALGPNFVGFTLRGSF
jgi:hypothetical protein